MEVLVIHLRADFVAATSLCEHRGERLVKWITHRLASRRFCFIFYYFHSFHPKNVVAVVLEQRRIENHSILKLYGKVAAKFQRRKTL